MEIRKATTEDAAELLEVYRPYVEKTAVSFEWECPTVEEFRERMEKITAHFPYLVAVDSDGRIAGYCYAATFRTRLAYQWNVETTIYLREDMRGQGIGTALYLRLEEELKALGYLNMNACIAVPNGEDPYLTDASRAFHRSLGYREIGIFHHSGYKFGRWYDMCWLEKMLGEHGANPSPIRGAKE